MSAAITLADAISGLVAEKRAVGYKYRAEERMLDRFEAFCRREFPELNTVTKASVRGVDHRGPTASGKPATLQNLATPVRELARWLHRRGQSAYVLPAARCPDRLVISRTFTATRNSAGCSQQTDRCHYCPKVPLRNLVMPVLFRMIYACGLRCSEAGCCAAGR